MTIILFLLGLVLLIFTSQLFVDDSVKIAHTFHLSEMFIGVTLVSIGTTLPETMVSATASAIGHSCMAGGNAIGSIICNSALIAGLVWTISPLKSISLREFRKPFLKYFIAMITFCIIIYTTGKISRFAGAVLLVLLVIYIVSLYLDSSSCTLSCSSEPIRPLSVLSNVLRLLVESVILFFGARLLVTNGAELARMIGVPEQVISISIIALGTSLPELFTAISSLIKGHSSLSLGNIIGANTLNILLVSGLASVIAPIPFAQSTLRVDLPVMIGISLILALPAIRLQKSTRLNGGILFASYIAYTCFLYFTA